MITMKELLGDHNATECTQEQLINLKELLFRVNRVRADWGKPMIITSGLRNDADMERIYKSKKYPRMSKHLFGQACDISDPNLELYNWLIANNCEKLKLYDLWMEKGTKNWCHLQIVPMASYSKTTDVRVFNP